MKNRLEPVHGKIDRRKMPSDFVREKGEWYIIFFCFSYTLRLCMTKNHCNNNNKFICVSIYKIISRFSVFFQIKSETESKDVSVSYTGNSRLSADLCNQFVEATCIFYPIRVMMSWCKRQNVINQIF